MQDLNRDRVTRRYYLSIYIVMLAVPLSIYSKINATFHFILIHSVIIRAFLSAPLRFLMPFARL